MNATAAALHVWSRYTLRWLCRLQSIRHEVRVDINKTGAGCAAYVLVVTESIHAYTAPFAIHLNKEFIITARLCTTVAVRTTCRDLAIHRHRAHTASASNNGGFMPQLAVTEECRSSLTTGHTVPWPFERMLRSSSSSCYPIKP
jgi:hypothetical protein